MLEQYFSSQEFWKDIPFGYITTLLLMIWIGFLIQDCYNKDSWIRTNIRLLRRLFIIGSTSLISPRVESYEWSDITCRIQFIKDAKNVKVILRVYSCINKLHAQKKFILETREFDRVHQDQQEIFTLATMFIKSYDNKPPGYSSWGQKHRISGDADRMETLFDSSHNLVEIEVKSGWRTQTEFIFFAISNKYLHGYNGLFIAPKDYATAIALINQDATNS